MAISLLVGIIGDNDRDRSRIHTRSPGRYASTQKVSGLRDDELRGIEGAPLIKWRKDAQFGSERVQDVCGGANGGKDGTTGALSGAECHVECSVPQSRRNRIATCPSAGSIRCST